MNERDILTSSFLLLSKEDLWEALEAASSKPVAKVMSTWTKQMGYPVLTVEGKQVRLCVCLCHMTIA